MENPETQSRLISKLVKAANYVAEHGRSSKADYIFIDMRGEQSQGKIELGKMGDKGYHTLPIMAGEVCIAEVDAHDPEDNVSPTVEASANAHLYVEAHNVANTTGMWPSDLVDRIRLLEDKLSSVVETMGYEDRDDIEEIRILLETKL